MKYRRDLIYLPKDNLIGWNHCSLDSTHVVRCKSMLGFQNLGGLPEFLVHFAKNTLFLSSQETSLPPPTPENENSARIWVLSSQEYSPSPRNENENRELELECVETNRCIPQGYQLVVSVKTKILHWRAWNIWQLRPLVYWHLDLTVSVGVDVAILMHLRTFWWSKTQRFIWVKHDILLH